MSEYTPSDSQSLFARNLLIQTISTAFDEGVKQGYVQHFESPSVGTFDLIAGEAPTGSVQGVMAKNDHPIRLTVVRQQLPQGEQLAHILTRGARIGRTVVSLTPTEADTEVIVSDTYSTLRDTNTVEMLEATSFDPMSSIIAAENVIHRPGILGLPSDLR